MEAAIDSSALIFAFRVEALGEILKKRYSKLLIPKAVYEEVIEAGRRLGREEVEEIEEEIAEGFVGVEAVKVMELGHLGRGEAEVLSLALAKGLPAIMDDRKGRMVGTAMRLKVIPISSYIIWGLKEGHLDKGEAEGILNELVKGGYRLKSDVYIAIVDKIRRTPTHKK